MKEVSNQIKQFNKERDWDQFHSPENLAKSISIEAGKLLECFQWNDNYDKEEVCEELADVFTFSIWFNFSWTSGKVHIFSGKVQEPELFQILVLVFHQLSVCSMLVCPPLIHCKIKVCYLRYYLLPNWLHYYFYSYLIYYY